MARTVRCEKEAEGRSVLSSGTAVIHLRLDPYVMAHNRPTGAGFSRPRCLCCLLYAATVSRTVCADVIWQFLNFFKMAIKFLVITLFLALAVIKPVHDQFPESDTLPKRNKTHTDTMLQHQTPHRSWNPINVMGSLIPTPSREADYLWMYIAFAYFFTGLAMYLIISETRKIIDVRQDYLGSQSTVTDRTIRLSGIPMDLRSEERIKEFIENLEIGKVESVLLCKNWKELDEMMVKRMSTLRRLEESWTVYLGHRRVERSLETLPIAQPAPPGPEVGEGDREDSSLLGRPSNGGAHAVPYARPRPTTRLWYGRFKLRYRVVDAIDYYEEELRQVDEKIRELRKQEFEPCPLAFVTMDSVASCQMAVQAVLDSSPLQLLANTSPAPADVVWPNTYLHRNWRITRSWAITVVITLLTVFWSLILVPIAGLIDLDRIRKIFPSLADMLSSNPLAKSLVQTQLPTLVISLLNVLVPYLYDWLSNQQGMISQGDVELSVISKNFFFTFFNFFIIFTALGTAAMTPDNLGSIPLRDTANQLALQIQDLRNFYVNYIILQGFGLFPFRLLEFGSVSLYPIGLIGAKTPRGKYYCTENPPLLTCVRLCRARSTASLQLWILPSAEFADFPHLHCIQHTSIVMAGSPARPILLRLRLLRAQIPAALRHGPSTALHGEKLDHDLRPDHCRACHLSGDNGRPACATSCGQEISWNHPAYHCDVVVQPSVQPQLQAAYAFHRIKSYP